VNGVNFLPSEVLLRPQGSEACKPILTGGPVRRVTDWGFRDDTHPGDLFFAIVEAAFSLGASEIQLTPLPEQDEVLVHFRCGSEFRAQAPLTPVQFGLLAVLLPHTCLPPDDSTPRRYFTLSDGTRYFMQYRKMRQTSSTAILITLVPEHSTRAELVRT
jgi:hypothetical protein